MSLDVSLQSGHLRQVNHADRRLLHCHGYPVQVAGLLPLDLKDAGVGCPCTPRPSLLFCLPRFVNPMERRKAKGLHLLECRIYASSRPHQLSRCAAHPDRMPERRRSSCGRRMSKGIRQLRCPISAMCRQRRTYTTTEVCIQQIVVMNSALTHVATNSCSPFGVIGDHTIWLTGPV